MKIEGGTVTIMRDDELPVVTILGATVLLDTKTVTLEESTAFLVERIGRGSHIEGCTLWDLDGWCKKVCDEAVSRAKEPRKPAKSLWLRIVEACL